MNLSSKPEHLRGSTGDDDYSGGSYSLNNKEETSQIEKISSESVKKIISPKGIFASTDNSNTYNSAINNSTELP
jgi:hypothetical protein